MPSGRLTFGVTTKGAVALCGLAIMLLLAPLFSLLVKSLQPGLDGGGIWTNYAVLLQQSDTVQPLLNSLTFAVGSALLATIIGAIGALLVAGTNIAGKRFLAACLLLPLFLPGLIYGFGWIVLGGPNGGMINQLVGARTVNIFTMAGMILIEALHAVPLVFLLLLNAARSFPADALIAARLTGGSRRACFLRICLPLLAPALVAGWLLIFIRAFGAFEIPGMMGIPSGLEFVSTHIYFQLQHDLEDLSTVSAFASVIMAFTLVLLLLEQARFSNPAPTSLLSGTSMPVVLDLGRWRRPLGVALCLVLGLVAGLPLYALVSRSLLLHMNATAFWQPWSDQAQYHLGNYARVLQDSGVWAAAGRSLLWGGLAAFLLMGLAAVLVWGSTRLRSRWAGRLIALSHLVFSMPGIIIGLAILVFHSGGAWSLFGSSAIIGVVYLTRGLPYALVHAQRGLMSMPADLWDAGRLNGVSRSVMFARVLAPLTWPVFLAGTAYVLAMSVREVSATVLLYRPGKEFLSVYLWQFWQDGELGLFSALSICFTALTALLLALSYRTFSPSTPN